MKAVLKLLIFVAILFAAWSWLKPKRYPNGVLVSAEPMQTTDGLPDAPWHKDGFSFRALARIELDARVLHRKTYRSDAAARIAPYDLALGWGPMSDQAVLDRLKISQGNRFFFWESENAPPIPPDMISAHATNTHLIPSTHSMGWRIWRLGAGDLVHLRGLLVEVTAPNMPAWTSSLSRTDTGKGACEIVWVESIQKVDHIPHLDFTSVKLDTLESKPAR